MRLSHGLICLVMGLCVGSPQARAQVTSSIIDEFGDSIGDITDVLFPGVTNIRLGLGPAISPDYEGADNYDIKPLPLLSFRYKDLIEVDNNHLRVNLFGLNSLVRKKHFRAGPQIRVDFGRDEDDNPDLSGLGNIGTSVELGVFGSYTVGPARARIRVLHDVAGGHSGTKVIGDVRWVLLKTDRLAVSGSASTTWADNTYMDEFFGINTAQALASGLPSFNAGAGLKDAGISVVANYKLSRHWALLGNVEYKRLLGDAGDSPIVSTRGSADQAAAGVFVIYSFH